jgi:Zn-dependent M28 family amino/carboxypeptidase
MFRLPGRSHAADLPPLSSREQAIVAPLSRDVHHLAETIGERNVFNPERLHEAERWLISTLESDGWQVQRQEYEVDGVLSANLEIELTGTSLPEEIVVVGAHYDSVIGSPGANDNATGVAALLTLARHFRTATPERTLRLVFFVNEEPPFFTTASMGSVVYARRSRERGEKIVAMLSLETIGYYSDRTGSQEYPAALAFLFPAEGNFIAFVANVGSRRMLNEVVEEFRRRATIPSEGAALPPMIPGVGWSDHWSFWQYDYPGVMVTDTALFRDPHYHTARDTAERLDYERLARVTVGLEYVVRQLAGMDE